MIWTNKFEPVENDNWNEAHCRDKRTIRNIVGINLHPYEQITYGKTFESNFECFFPVARFIISGSATLFTNVVEINGTTTLIKYTDDIGVKIGGNAKHAHIVFIRARLHPQHTQNYEKKKQENSVKNSQRNGIVFHTWMQFQSPFEKRLESSIMPKIENESSRQTATEHGSAFNWREM